MEGETQAKEEKWERKKRREARKEILEKEEQEWGK